MRILTRYLLRLHLVPFVFSLVALTGILLLNQIARRLSELLGKGLHWTVIAEVFGLSLPFLVAMTLPMAVLVAVLYTFSRLTAENEITALRASGISVGRLVVPVLMAGTAVAAAAFLFSDHVLPRSNHRLRTLLVDIQRKKPTFSLKEQVINEVQRNRFFLRAALIEPGTFFLRDVTIYDIQDPDRRRIIYADSGHMAFTPDLRDLQLTLFDGTMHEFDRTQPEMFQQADFARDLIRVPGVGNELQRTLNDTFKGDREMGVCEMEQVISSARKEERRAQREVERVSENGLRMLVGLTVLPPDTQEHVGHASIYCRALERFFSWMLPAELRAQQQRTREPAGAIRRITPPTRQNLISGRSTRPRVTEFRSLSERIRGSRIRAASFSAEVQKKYAIAVACIVFVLVGVPVGIRFPTGGVGMVIGISLVVFTTYYVGLIAGEALSDRLIISPFWAMWSSNVIFSILGLVGLYRIRTAATANRSGGWSDLFERLKIRPWLRGHR